MKVNEMSVGEQSEIMIPAELPILPLRGVVVYPMMWLPLTIGQERSIRLVDDALVDSSDQRIIGLVTSKAPDVEEPNPDQIYQVGTAAIVHRMLRAPDGTIRLIVQGIERIHIDEYLQEQPYLRARVSQVPDDEGPHDLELEAMMRATLDLFRRLVSLVPHMPEELETAAMNATSARQLAYLVAASTRMEPEQAQEILEIDQVSEKLVKLNSILSKELEVLELGKKIQSQAQDEMTKMQREYFLREQLKAIQRELGEGDEQTLEIEEFRQKIEAAGMPEEAAREARRELDRMARLPTAAAEYGVIRTYLDWLVNLPWKVQTEDNLDIAHARAVLDEDHYGLKDIKERILEYLAVRKLRQERAGEIKRETRVDYVRREREGAILCFVGPPGVGKTSLGASIARAMGRKFTRMSLGGIRDEAEIRGFRRTYIGAMPGRLIQTMRRVESRNPVIMLDEIDKLGRDFRGDPASALLEVLDPEQNFEFRDHYLDVAYDLSQVLFITTANTLDTIPMPLLDRMEIIQLSGYTEQEKVQIAQRYLVPRQVRENGLRPEELTFTDEALLEIIRNYTREAGVRNLEREIGRVARKIVTRIAEGKAEAALIDQPDIRDLLDHPRFGYQTEIEERITDTPGVAIGLSVTVFGGDVLFVEAAQMPGSKGFQYTGQLGEVMQESARAAFSYIRSKASDFGLRPDYFDKHDIHLHVPAGAVPKDGPSAGVTMATALMSLITGRPVRRNVAMTGEITLRGQVLPVGGIKAKVLAAHRAGLDTVILPRRNEPDVEDVPEEVRQAMTFIFVDDVTAALEAALTPPKQTGDGAAAGADEQAQAQPDAVSV